MGLGAYKGAAERRLTGGRKYAPKGNGKDEKVKKERAKGKLLLFMTENDIEKIQVDDGCGKKGKIAKNANGEFKVSITSNDTL